MRHILLITPYTMYLETRDNTLYIGGTCMRALDKVIGYESIKLELYRIIDIFHNPEKYKALGVSVPKGFILEGEPGIHPIM